jgi:hypothetical protein
MGLVSSCTSPASVSMQPPAYNTAVIPVLEILRSPDLPKTAFVNAQVLCVARRNNKRKLVIPSLRNRIGPWYFSNVIIDGGCSSLLIPIKKVNFLLQLHETYPHLQYCRWEIKRGRGQYTYTLNLKGHDYNNSFPITLGEDLGAGTFEAKRLRFFLCKEDLQFLWDERDGIFVDLFSSQQDLGIYSSDNHFQLVNERETPYKCVIEQSMLAVCQSWYQTQFCFIFQRGCYISGSFVEYIRNSDAISWLDRHYYDSLDDHDFHNIDDDDDGRDTDSVIGDDLVYEGRDEEGDEGYHPSVGDEDKEQLERDSEPARIQNE